MSELIPVSLGVFLRNISKDSLEIWMQIRDDNGPLKGLWEFPGGRIEDGESSEIAIRREVQEEVGIELAEKLSLPLFKIYNLKDSYRVFSLYVHLGLGEEFPESSNQKWFIFNYRDKSNFLKGNIPLDNHRIIDNILDYMSTESCSKTLGEICF